MVITQSQLLEAVPNLHKPRLDAFVASFNMWAVQRPRKMRGASATSCCTSRDWAENTL